MTRFGKLVPDSNFRTRLPLATRDKLPAETSCLSPVFQPRQTSATRCQTRISAHELLWQPRQAPAETSCLSPVFQRRDRTFRKSGARLEFPHPDSLWQPETSSLRKLRVCRQFSSRDSTSENWCQTRISAPDSSSNPRQAHCGNFVSVASFPAETAFGKLVPDSNFRTRSLWQPETSSLRKLRVCRQFSSRDSLPRTSPALMCVFRTHDRTHQIPPVSRQPHRQPKQAHRGETKISPQPNKSGYAPGCALIQ